MTIRPAVADDLDAIRAILAETKVALDGLAYDDFTGLALVAERHREVVGFLQMVPARPYAILTECAIARAYQRRGYAVRLLEAAELLLRCQGIHAWVTFTDRAEVIEQLERWGAGSTGVGQGFVRRL